jgi:hypothetical protein
MHVRACHSCFCVFARSARAFAHVCPCLSRPERCVCAHKHTSYCRSRLCFKLTTLRSKREDARVCQRGIEEKTPQGPGPLLSRLSAKPEGAGSNFRNFRHHLFSSLHLGLSAQSLVVASGSMVVEVHTQRLASAPRPTCRRHPT